MTSLTDAFQHHSNKHQSHDVAYQGPPSFSLLESIPMGNGFILSSGQDERVSLRPLCPVRVANIPELRSHSYQKWIQGIQLEAAAGEILGIFIPRMPHVEKSSLPGPTTVFVYTSFPGPFANWKVLSLLLCLLWRTHNTEVAALAWCDIIFQFKCQALAESYFSCLEDRSSAGPVNLSYSGG
jgi:hypothetical protein